MFAIVAANRLEIHC